MLRKNTNTKLETLWDGPWIIEEIKENKNNVKIGKDNKSKWINFKNIRPLEVVRCGKNNNNQKYYFKENNNYLGNKIFLPHEQLSERPRKLLSPAEQARQSLDSPWKTNDKLPPTASNQEDPTSRPTRSPTGGRVEQAAP